jgi:hypothetical protein
MGCHIHFASQRFHTLQSWRAMWGTFNSRLQALGMHGVLTFHMACYHFKCASHHFMLNLLLHLTPLASGTSVSSDQVVDINSCIGNIAICMQMRQSSCMFR